MIFFIESNFSANEHWDAALRKARNDAAMTSLCHLRNTSRSSDPRRLEFSCSKASI